MTSQREKDALNFLFPSELFLPLLCDMHVFDDPGRISDWKEEIGGEGKKILMVM